MDCISCGGTGKTPYSMMSAQCLICNGSGQIAEEPLCAMDCEGLTLEEHSRYKDFMSRHMCSLREGGSLELDYTLSVEIKSGIGANKYVKCNACGCIHDITDYGVW